MKKLALVDAATAEPFFRQAPLPLSQLERLAEDCGLPGAVVTNSTGIIPLHAIEQFMVRLGDRIGDPLFFTRTLQEETGADTSSIANIPMPTNITGVEAVRAIASRISDVLYGARFFCLEAEDRVWLLRTAATTEWTDLWAVQQYNLAAGLQAVRSVLARPVRPVALRLNRAVERAALPEEMRDLPIELSGESMGLAFRRKDLLGPSDGVVARAHDKTCGVCAGADKISIDEISDCIASFLGSTARELLTERVARAFGMSGRSYRRRLQELGTSHKALLADARLTAAEQLLRDPDQSVTEIAFELGYAHPPAFTRFFTDRVGISPATYRRRALN